MTRYRSRVVALVREQPTTKSRILRRLQPGDIVESDLVVRGERVTLPDNPATPQPDAQASIAWVQIHRPVAGYVFSRLLEELHERAV